MSHKVAPSIYTCDVCGKEESSMFGPPRNWQKFAIYYECDERWKYWGPKYDVCSACIGDNSINYQSALHKVFQFMFKRKPTDSTAKGDE